MGLSVADRPVWPLTAEQVLRIAELGLLPEYRRLELLHGVLTERPVKSPAHVLVKTRLLRWLHAGLPDGRYDIRVEDPLLVPDRTSLPEPDLAVVDRSDAPPHPTSAWLVIEVAVTSVEVDVTTKAPLYAAAGVPEYWVVDVVARRLLRFTGPRGDGYAGRDVLVPPATLRPEEVDVAAVDLAGLLAGL